MIQNHYGYGVRNDEEPYAHKVPQGGNWRNLTHEEKLAFWNGIIPTTGGCTNGLRRMAWDEPGVTITTTPFQKLSCQLHPGTEPTEGGLRVYNVIPQREPNDFTVAELFAGGGLMAAGLHASGYEIIWANDFDKSACIAYRHNHGDYIIHGDITAIDPDDIPDTDIIAGGPPCQDYSVAGEGAGEDGERGKLVWTYLSIIEKKQPKAFIFENVKGLVQKAHIHTFHALINAFDSIGYKVSYKVVNAWDYGVAQKRERVFIVGVREDLGFKFVFPEPLAGDFRTQMLRDVIGDLPEPETRTFTNQTRHDNPSEMDEPAKTIIASATGGKNAFYNHEPKELSDEAIAYLHSKDGRSLKKHRPPTLDEPGQTIVANIHKGVPYGLHYPDNHDPRELSDKAVEYIDRNWEHRGSRVKEMDEPSATVSAVYAKGVPYGLFYPENHERKDISEKALEGYERRGQEGSGFGYRVNDWDEPSPTIFGRIFNEGKAFVHPSAKELENHDGHLFDNVNPNWTYEQTMRPASWEKPSATISSHSRCEGIHPEQAPPRRPRRFTVRECLRIQSVPDWYVFPDSISLSAQYRIVGNGVASRVSYLLGIALADQLKGAIAHEEGQIDLFDILDRSLPRQRTRKRREEQA